MIYRTYENIETGERHNEFLKISEHDQYLIDHPELKHVFGAIPTVDAVGIGITKPPSDFLKYGIGRVKETQPGANANALEKRWHIPREW